MHCEEKGIALRSPRKPDFPPEHIGGRAEREEKRERKRRAAWRHLLEGRPSSRVSLRRPRAAAGRQRRRREQSTPQQRVQPARDGGCCCLAPYIASVKKKKKNNEERCCNFVFLDYLGVAVVVITRGEMKVYIWGRLTRRLNFEGPSDYGEYMRAS